MKINSPIILFFVCLVFLGILMNLKKNQTIFGGSRFDDQTVMASSLVDNTF